MNQFRAIMRKRPILTQMITSGISPISYQGSLFAAGDILTQTTYENHNLRDYDYDKTLKLACIISINIVYGTVVTGPSMAFWFRFLSKHIILASPTKSLIAKVCIDQIIFAPIFITIFFTYNGLVSGESPEDIKQRIKVSFWPALTGNWMVWPGVQ